MTRMSSSVSAMSATIGQLLRSGQRDDQYLNELNTELNAIIQYWFGIRQWIRIRHHLHSLSQLIYYSLTTLSGLQTLGEEYVNIVQTDGNRLLVPKLLNRFVAILLQTFSPYLLSRLLQSIRRRIESREIVLTSGVDSHRRGEQLLRLMAIIEDSFQYIHRIHLILFYFNGNYYYLSKRLTNIRYVSLNGQTAVQSDSRPRNLYKALGYLSLSQLCIALMVKLYSFRNIGIKSSDSLETHKSESSLDSTECDVSHRCSLCLEKRRQTTATTCGHLFCWYCITEWLQLKTECPLCREPLKSSRLVLLNNFP